MNQSQLFAYSSIQKKLSDRRATVLNAIEQLGGGATLFEIQKHLNWPINRVSGRVTELREVGLLMDSGETRINPESGYPGTVWKVAE